MDRAQEFETRFQTARSCLCIKKGRGRGSMLEMLAALHGKLMFWPQNSQTCTYKALVTWLAALPRKTGDKVRVTGNPEQIRTLQGFSPAKLP